MNESPGKENKESELLYRLNRRNPLMVMFDFIRFSFFPTRARLAYRDIL